MDKRQSVIGLIGTSIPWFALDWVLPVVTQEPLCGRRTGRRITNNEGYTLFYNLMTIKCSSGRPDKSMPEKALKGTGYAPGVSRLGVAKA